MKRSRMVLMLWLLVAGVAIGLSTAALDAQQRNLLVSKQTATPPALDGTLDGPWNAAVPLTVKVVGGRNLPGGTTDVTLRSLYAGDSIYFHVQYRDATESMRRGPWIKQADGAWVKAKDPSDKGGDNNLVYEDKFAVLWNMSSPSFEQRGCLAACHTGEGKPFGNKYTAGPGERLDMWHLKGVRTGYIGQIDDQYVDDTRYDRDRSPNAGRKNDPKTGGGYVDNVSDDKKGPRFALKDNAPAPPYWIVDAEKAPFDGSKYKAGDEVPGIIVTPFTGDRGDVSAKIVWADGVWTMVFWRKLVTGSEFDVQFSDLRKPYAFGVAVFDNAQVRHAYNVGVLKLTFD